MLGAGNGVECVCVCVDFCKVEKCLSDYHFWEEDNTCVTKYFSHPRVDNRMQTLCRLRMTMPQNL